MAYEMETNYLHSQSSLLLSEECESDGHPILILNCSKRVINAMTECF
jgi:hypothetical protein